MFKLLIVSLEGHHPQTEWDPNDPKQMKEVRKIFADKLKAGFRCFAQTKDGKTVPITELDVNAERIMITAAKTVLFQPNVGG